MTFLFNVLQSNFTRYRQSSTGSILAGAYPAPMYEAQARSGQEEVKDDVVKEIEKARALADARPVGSLFSRR